MAFQIAGLTTLGMKVGYAVETVAGQRPAKFKWLQRADSIGGIDLPTENIDVSAIEDYQTRYAPGRQDSGGEWAIGFNYTDEVKAQLTEMIAAYNEGISAATPLKMWFTVWHPSLQSNFDVVAAPPQLIPMPEIGQNEKLVVSMTMTIDEYKGVGTKVEPVENP